VITYSSTVQMHFSIAARRGQLRTQKASKVLPAGVLSQILLGSLQRSTCHLQLVGRELAVFHTPLPSNNSEINDCLEDNGEDY